MNVLNETVLEDAETHRLAKLTAANLLALVLLRDGEVSLSRLSARFGVSYDELAKQVRRMRKVGRVELKRLSGKRVRVVRGPALIVYEDARNGMLRLLEAMEKKADEQRG